MAYLILKGAPDSDERDYVERYSQESISLPTVMDELKLELFLENINKKSLEDLQAFFDKKR